MYVCVQHIQGSWKIALRNAFKNFRRDSPSGESASPPAKRIRLAEEEFNEEEITEDEYEVAVKQIKAEYQKGSRGGKNHATIKQLMDKTQKKRMQWIRDARPLVSDVVDAFPCLKTSKGVSVKMLKHGLSIHAVASTRV